MASESDEIQNIEEIESSDEYEGDDECDSKKIKKGKGKTKKPVSKKKSEASRKNAAKASEGKKLKKEFNDKLKSNVDGLESDVLNNYKELFSLSEPPRGENKSDTRSGGDVNKILDLYFNSLTKEIMSLRESQNEANKKLTKMYESKKAKKEREAKLRGDEVRSSKKVNGVPKSKEIDDFYKIVGTKIMGK